MACNHAEVGDPMTEVLEARRSYDQARLDGRALVDRARARLGRAIHEARRAGGAGAQSQVMKALGKSREQVRAFEAAYAEWQRVHPDEEP
jgi:hypothetical protein